MLVSLSTSVRGLVPLAHLSADAMATKKFLEHFLRGMGVRVLVRKVDEERRGLILSLKGECGWSSRSIPEQFLKMKKNQNAYGDRIQGSWQT